MAPREAELASIAYFYCDFRDEDKQSRRGILLSILFQFSAQSDLCLDALSNPLLETRRGCTKTQ